jgi:hypothetical protein
MAVALTSLPPHKLKISILTELFSRKLVHLSCSVVRSFLFCCDS